MTQCEQILQDMQDNGGITSLDAIREFGCTRLSGRIYDLKKQGHDIKKQRVTGKNRYGKPVSYDRYFM